MSKKLNLVCKPKSVSKNLINIIGYDSLSSDNSEHGVIELSGPDECWHVIRSICEGGMVVKVAWRWDQPNYITCFCSEK